MPKRTVVYQQMPWLGGRNTSLDPALIDPTQLVTADNVLFDTDGAKKRRPGFASFGRVGDGRLDVDLILDSSVLSDGIIDASIGLKEY